MTEILEQLYEKFYNHLELTALQDTIQHNHEILISSLSAQDKKTVLKIMDAMDMVCNLQIKNAFIQGVKLGTELTTELQKYNPQSLEIDSTNFEDFFMV